jgi:hypothetical protein
MPLIAAALLLGPFSASAVPMLRLSSEGHTVTVTDNGAGDLSDTDGLVLFYGSLPGWSINITSGFSKPLLGSALQPILDLASANFTSYGGASALEIWLTDTDFAPTSSAHTMAGIGGTTDGTVTYQAYYDSTNTAFGTGNLLADMSFSNWAFSGSEGGSLTALNPFSLTLYVNILHDAALPFRLTSFDASVKVPEPTALALFAAGVLAVGFVARRRFAPAKR